MLRTRSIRAMKHHIAEGDSPLSALTHGRETGVADLPNAREPGRETGESRVLQPIVHIGYHKTATTWFQTSVYPTSPSHRWIPRRQVWRALLDPPGTRFDPVEAHDLLYEADDGRPVAICEENLSGYIHNGGLHGFLAPAVAKRIKAVLPDAKIVIFVRSQAQMIAACYAQYVRGGGTHGLDRYLFPERYHRGAQGKRFKIPRFSFDHFEYDRLVSIYDAHFGRENVHVYAYETMREPAELLALMGTELAIEWDWDRLSFRRRNFSWNESLIPFARFLNRFTARTVEDKDFLLHIPGWYAARSVVLQGLALMSSSRGGRFTLPARYLGWIEERYAASNQRLLALRPGLAEVRRYSGDHELKPAAGPIVESPAFGTVLAAKSSSQAVR